MIQLPGLEIIWRQENFLVGAGEPAPYQKLIPAEIVSAFSVGSVPNNERYSASTVGEINSDVQRQIKIMTECCEGKPV